MVNILVPTDFSPLSKIAVRYANQIANQLKGNITLLHVIDLEKQFRSALRMQTGVREIMKSIQGNFQSTEQEVIKQFALEQDMTEEATKREPFKFKISKGQSFTDTVLRESRRLRSGLIVMGTRGATGLKRTLIGSNTASIIGSSHIPVLAVPERANFTGFRNVIHATDLKNLERELEILIPYIKRFESTIHVIHIAERNGNISDIEERLEETVRGTGYKNIVTLVTVDPDISGAIEQYVSIAKGDLLAMFTHEPTFFEKVFDKSVTRSMAFHSRIPLLAFKNVEFISRK
jgi:nucleotide-binding universal stress UspA family protein